MNIAIIGASNDKSKYGNKAVRAYAMMGHTVFPVNPKEKEIEGHTCYKTITAIPYKIDRVSLYVPPEVGIRLVGQIKKVKPKEVYINPGAESDELVDALGRAGIRPLLVCAINAIGINPNNL